MAIGRVEYRKSTNLEPIASAINGMGQQASKKDKPIILGQKISAISTDATATPAQVLIGQTFYSAGKKQQGIIPIAGGTETPVSVSKQNNYDLSVFPPAKYFKGTTESGILLPIGTLRGQGYALQTEVDTWINNYNTKVTELTNMTNDRNNWMNVANSKLSHKVVTVTVNRSSAGVASGSVTHGLNTVPKYVFAVLQGSTGMNDSVINGICFPLGYSCIRDPYSTFGITVSASSTSVTISSTSDAFAIVGTFLVYIFG
jgi:hypothetical protein